MHSQKGLMHGRNLAFMLQLSGMTTASSEKCVCRVFFAIFPIDVVELCCFIMGYFPWPMSVVRRPHRKVECTLTGIHCGTFHTAFDAPSHLPPFSSSCKFCRLERMLGQMGCPCGVFL